MANSCQRAERAERTETHVCPLPLCLVGVASRDSRPKPADRSRESVNPQERNEGTGVSAGPLALSLYGLNEIGCSFASAAPLALSSVTTIKPSGFAATNSPTLIVSGTLAVPFGATVANAPSPTTGLNASY